MKRLIEGVAALTAAMIISGCGLLDHAPADGFTQVRFAQKQRQLDLFRELGLGALSYVNGGLMIYFHGTDGPAFSHVYLANESDSGLSYSIPNARYRVAALGYSASDLGGSVYCGFGNGGNDVALTGGSQTISIDMTGANCGLPSAAPYFSDSNFMLGSAPRFVEAVFCHGDLGLISTGTDACDGIGRPTPATEVQSFRMGYSYQTAAGEDLMGTNCQLVGTYGVGQGGGKPIFVGTATPGPRPMPTRVITYSDTACATPLGEFIFPQGFFNGGAVFGKNVSIARGRLVPGSGSQARVYVAGVF